MGVTKGLLMMNVVMIVGVQFQGQQLGALIQIACALWR
jgi:hypothetical protein